MKKLLITTILILLCNVCYAQCVAEVKDVILDEIRGSIIVETEYKLNGIVVDIKANPNPDATGRTRYTEESGTIAEIVALAKADIQEHCENLIIRHAIAVNDLQAQQLLIQKALTEPMISTLKTNAVGWTKQVDKKIFNFKNKEITVNADGTYSVTDLP